MATIGPVKQTVAEQLLTNTQLCFSYIGGKGHTGQHTSVIKSALQKACRRNNVELAQWAVREAYLYFIMGTEYILCDSRAHQKKAAKAFHTNFMNRLRVIAVEDTSPRSISAVNKSMECLSDYAAGCFKDPSLLMESAMKLVAAAGSRTCSHLRALCSERNGAFFEKFSEQEDRHEGSRNIPPENRIKHIFDILVSASPSMYCLNNLRSVVAYHALKYYTGMAGIFYRQYSKREMTKAFKKKCFDNFWQKCKECIHRLSLEREAVWKYRSELLYAVTWRQHFFCSKGFFREENILLISILDLIIAVAFGDSAQFEDIQTGDAERERNYCRSVTSKKHFDWITDHNVPSDIPVYVFDQHTNENHYGVSFALQGCTVVGGDESWTVQLWRDSYTYMRMDEDRTLELEACPYRSATELLYAEASQAVLGTSRGSFCIPGGGTLPFMVVPCVSETFREESEKNNVAPPHKPAAGPTGDGTGPLSGTVSSAGVKAVHKPSQEGTNNAQAEKKNSKRVSQADHYCNAKKFKSYKNIGSRAQKDAPLSPHLADAVHVQCQAEPVLSPPGLESAKQELSVKEVIRIILLAGTTVPMNVEACTRFSRVDAVVPDRLPVIPMEDIDKVIWVHNKKSKKGVVASVLMKDSTVVIFKEMRKSFGYGSHQNFIQVLKDNNTCEFKHLLPCPGSGGRRGLYTGIFTINRHNGAVEECADARVYFITGCVKRKGSICETRMAKCVDRHGKAFLGDSRQLTDILLFRLMTGVSDTNSSNILVGSQNELYSVDENFVGSIDPRVAVTSRKFTWLRDVLLSSMKSKNASVEYPVWLLGTVEDRVRVLFNIYKVGRQCGIELKTLIRIFSNAAILVHVFHSFIHGLK